MGIQYNAFALFALAATASALKCMVGTGDTKTSTDCTSGLDRCINITTSGITAYSCNSAAVIAVSTIADKKCTTVSSIVTCLCDTDDCNTDTSTGTETQAGLKCHVGTSKDEAAALAATTACASGLDRCSKAMKDGNTVWLCVSAATQTAAGYTDEACSTVDTTEQCLCKGDGCNSAPTQTATQAIILFAVSSMMKFALN